MSSLLGPVVDADLRRWQRRRYVLLGEFLDLGDRRELPVLSWRVGDHSLIGEAQQPDHGHRRVAFCEWVDALDLYEWKPSTSATGRTHLHAMSRDWQGRAVDVVVVADVWDSESAG
jgi:hypothetical protein